MGACPNLASRGLRDSDAPLTSVKQSVRNGQVNGLVCRMPLDLRAALVVDRDKEPDTLTGSQPEVGYRYRQFQDRADRYGGASRSAFGPRLRALTVPERAGEPAERLPD